MTWFKVDDGFAFHQKTVEAGNAALGLWVRAGSWCSQHETDGLISRQLVAAMGSPAQAKRLVDAGLWVETEHGYQFHDWGQCNPTRHDLEISRKKERGRKENWRRRQNETPIFPEPPRSETQETRDTTDPVTRDTGSGRGSSKNSPSSDSPVREPAQQKSQRGTRIPDNFTVTAEMVRWAREKVPHVNGKTETEKFVNYWRSKSGRDATKVDWTRTWYNWMLSAGERTGRPPAQGTMDDDFWDR